MDPVSNQTLSAVTVDRRSDDGFVIRWNPTPGSSSMTIYGGLSPDRIDETAPLARVNARCVVTLDHLHPGRPHYFKLAAADGTTRIVGERRPAVEGAPNLRDLGGYATAAGRHVKWGQVFRSSHLSRLTDRGVEFIRHLGIRRVYDLRTEAEVLKMPNRFPDSADASYHRLPIQHGDFEPTAVFDRIKKGDVDWISEEFMLRGYIESIEHYPHVWQRLFSDLADPKNRPLLFHCTGGKDRTGTGAALILLALGVAEEPVVRDYGLSDGYNAETRQTIYAHLQPMGVDIARVEPYFTAPESRIRALLDYIRNHYQTALDYLVKKAGVGEKEIGQLRDGLLD
ncbi:MAG: tyrosine-protein phosphatase [Desulfobacterales bacterium]|jgi:protein-tyrosine phosphatase|nr:tyrosine-protein phosphatase [Desulfobacterales bacterium]